MHSVRIINLSLKSQRFSPPGCKNIGIRIFDFAAKTQLLWNFFLFKKKEGNWIRMQMIEEIISRFNMLKKSIFLIWLSLYIPGGVFCSIVGKSILRFYKYLILCTILCLQVYQGASFLSGFKGTVSAISRKVSL